jgi:hypothetical protein
MAKQRENGELNEEPVDTLSREASVDVSKDAEFLN